MYKPKKPNPTFPRALDGTVPSSVFSLSAQYSAAEVILHILPCAGWEALPLSEDRMGISLFCLRG